MAKKQYKLANGTPLKLPTSPLGEGGEAYVYKINATHVAKIYKETDDSCFTSLPGNQAAQAVQMATERLSVYNQKLKVFPKGLPSTVLAPQELIFDEQGLVKGYIMPLIANPMTWLQYADPGKRQNNLGNDDMTTLLLLLHSGTKALHDKGIILGDYNDNNFLIKQGIVYFVDTDAYQFGQFPSLTFTQTYVDPKICQQSPNGDFMAMTGHHSKETDWYAFSVFVANSLLCWHPYVGQHKPKAGGTKISNGLRPLQRLTILDPKKPQSFRDDILLPKFYTNLGPQILTDDCAHHLWEVFTKDKRGEFPRKLLEDMHWTTCTTCGTYHARHQCPSCNHLIRPLFIPIQQINGTVIAKILFDRVGQTLLHSTINHGQLAYVYHDGTNFMRENGLVVIPGAKEPGLRWEICGNKTILGKDTMMYIIAPNKTIISKQTATFAGSPIFSTNSKYYFWLDNGEIKRNVLDTTVFQQEVSLGNVLHDKTLFWTGEQFGFGVYGASSLWYFFCFNTEKKQMNTSVPITFKGEIIDASCSFTDTHCWFFVKYRDLVSKKTITNIYVITAQGEVVGKLENTDKPWATSVRGKSALGEKCLVNTDDGVYQLGITNSAIVELKHFVDTAPWGNSLARLHFLNGDLIVNDGKTITQLSIK